MKKLLLILIIIFTSFGAYADNYVVKAKNLNIRSMPSSTSDIIGTLQQNTIINVIEIKNGWAKFKYFDSEMGYISSKFVEIESQTYNIYHASIIVIFFIIIFIMLIIKDVNSDATENRNFVTDGHLKGYHISKRFLGVGEGYSLYDMYNFHLIKSEIIDNCKYYIVSIKWKDKKKSTISVDEKVYERIKHIPIKPKAKLELEIREFVKFHFAALITKRNQLVYLGDYGQWIFTAWNKELTYFTNNILIPNLDEKLLEKACWWDGKGWIMYAVDDIILEIAVERDKEKVSNRVNLDIQKHSIKTGEDFEQYIATLLSNAGFNIKNTPRSGDQGVDLIASKGSYTFVIQCKYFSKPVGNKAVQEIIAGKVYYNCPNGVVVTNNNYTASARKLASNADIILTYDGTIVEILNKMISSN